MSKPSSDITIQYKQTGASTQANHMGMREMQAMAYEHRSAPYLLLKSPPASGKSRALMYLALDKLRKQGLKKAIIAVPERSIGSSFKPTNLSEGGFAWDWHLEGRNNLCGAGDDLGKGKIQAFKRFLDSDDETLVCTHATLRFAVDEIADPSRFNNTVVGIDEFHHVSADEANVLGRVIDEIMQGSNAHIVAMTGSYFRGDGINILESEDEAQFETVTYTYYDQLNGYRHLKSIGIGYHFYEGVYFDALDNALDTTKKTIIHIPNVNSSESIGKHEEVDRILDKIGVVGERIGNANINRVTTNDGRDLLVANLVDDNKESRDATVDYLQNITSRDEMDIIIALGMAKEGFDWPWCEHVLTIGYRSSLTEVVQIVGRATRDVEGKRHAQFTNLIAMPDGADEDRKKAVNTLLKAITASLLMEQVLAPSIKFKPRSRIKLGEKVPKGTRIIEDENKPVSNRCADILEGGVAEYIADITATPGAMKLMAGDENQGRLLREEDIKSVLRMREADLSDDEIDLLAQEIHLSLAAQATGGLIDGDELPPDADVVGEKPPCDYTVDGQEETESYTDANSVPEPKLISRYELDSGETGSETYPSGRAGEKFLKVGSRFININNVNLDMISHINPFARGEEILSKHLTPDRLARVKDALTLPRNDVTEDEAVILLPRLKEFFKDKKRRPRHDANDPYEQRLAQVAQFVENYLKKKQAVS
ncbi:DEAD/DEAH box helicase [Salinivibrio sp. KP-1]|uniref:DEAD/DEAH box helicase n=1 Tax=Salinivibrio sp. KP-1 TaxID=1406902 RepID=UPI000ABA5E79|nr:ATP-dependent helicase [Salinivibrio sp. KP-1]